MPASCTAPRFAAAVLAFALAACGGDGGSGGDPTEPAVTTVAQTIEVPNVFIAANTSGFGASLLAAVEIRRIRLTVYEVPGGKVLFQNVFEVDPNQSKWTLSFTAPRGATVRLVTELMSVTAGVEKVEFSGQAGPITLNPCPGGCAPIPIPNYPGPVENLGATAVALSPRTAAATEGGTVQLGATVTPAGAAYQPVWSSLSEAVATVSATGLVTARAAGTARIVVAVGQRTDTATITVAAANTCVVAPYTLGSTTGGAWAASDCDAAGRRYDMYAFTAAQQVAFRAQVTGPAGRRISLRRAGTQEYVQLMASEAFMPSGGAFVDVRYVLAPGSYVLEIAAPSAGTLGAYTLATSLESAITCTPIVFVTTGVTITEQLSAADCVGPVGGREDRFILLPTTGTRVDLTLTPTGFPPVLVFRDDREGPASPTLASDIRSTTGVTARLAHTTTFEGFHEIVVSHANAGGSGAYTLTIGTASATSTCVPIATTLGGSRLALWEPADCRFDDATGDRYPLTLAAPTAFRGTLTSAQAPKNLGVFAGSNEVLNWTRTSAGDLAANWFLAPGQYELRASAATGTNRVPYTLLTAVTTGDIGCASNATSGNFDFGQQTLATGDCTFGNRFEDRLALLVQAGQEIVLQMNAAMGPAAIIRDPASPAGTFLVRTARPDAGTVTATWRAATTGYYQVIFSTSAENATGAYTGSVSVR